MLNIQEIKEKCPDAYKEISAWIKKTLILSTDDEEGGINRIVDITITYNPRFMYDFFDSKGIYLLTDYEGTGFSYKIITEEKVYKSQKTFPSRGEQEDKAFTEAFNILNESIKKAKSSL